MKVRCSNCGAIHSLDALISNDAASDALKAAFGMSQLGRAWIQYIGLFRPAKSQLSFDRLAKLTNEALSDIQSESITRDGVKYDAPPEAWIHAINQMLQARDDRKLTLPLTSHGYLYTIISKYKYVPVVEKSDLQESTSTSLGRMFSALGGNDG